MNSSKHLASACFLLGGLTLGPVAPAGIVRTNGPEVVLENALGCKLVIFPRDGKYGLGTDAATPC